MDTTVYIVEVTNSHNCTISDTVTIDVNPLPQITLTANSAICYGDTLQLSVSGGHQYHWTPATGLNCTTCADPVAAPEVTTTYTVEAISLHQCVSYDSVEITVNPLPTVVVSDDVTICKGDNAALEAQSVEAIRYEWTPAASLDNPSSKYPVAGPDSTTTYWLTVFNQYDCPATDSVTVEVIEQVKTTISADTAICQGDKVQLHATAALSGNLGTEYVWFPAKAIKGSTTPNPIMGPETTTTYTMLAYSGSCAPDTQQVTVTVNTLPAVNAGADQTVVRGTHLTFEPKTDREVTYHWTPATDLTCETCATPGLHVLNPGTFVLTVTDENGCVNSDTVDIGIVDACGDGVFVANAFTPNDDEINDKVYVRSLELKELHLFQIYNRWGNLIWETKDINEGWDGTHNGERLVPGVYVYFVKGICSNGEELTKKGNITLIE